MKKKKKGKKGKKKSGNKSIIDGDADKENNLNL